MSVRLDDRSIVRIEYRPQIDNYHVSDQRRPVDVEGAATMHLERPRLRQDHGREACLPDGRPRRGSMPEKLGTVYLRGREPNATQRPRWNEQSLNAFEQMLLAERPLSHFPQRSEADDGFVQEVSDRRSSRWRTAPTFFRYRGSTSGCGRCRRPSEPGFRCASTSSRGSTPASPRQALPASAGTSGRPSACGSARSSRCGPNMARAPG